MLRKKGFTLIELIIIIAIMGILVSLSKGLYKGNTKEAKLSQHLSYVKELGSASERYYMDKGNWPRAADEHYTSDELETYSKNIYDLTGEEVELDMEGKYYDINYVEISKYTKIPKDKSNYILQNPVGDVYYIPNKQEIKNGSPLTNNNSSYDLTKYTKVIYTDSIIGDDTNDGSINKPYKTLAKALESVQSGEAIYLGKGEYSVNKLDNLLNKHNVDYLGEGIETILNIDNYTVLNYSVQNKFYRMILQPSSTFPKSTSTYGLMTTYAKLYLYNNYTINLDFNNCLFRDPYNKLYKGSRHQTYIVGDNGRFTEHRYDINIVNSVSIDMPIISTWADYYERKVNPNIKIINSATTVSNIDCPNAECGNGYQHDTLKVTNSLEKAIFDTDYNITNATLEEIGLYYGKYSWK